MDDVRQYHPGYATYLEALSRDRSTRYTRKREREKKEDEKEKEKDKFLIRACNRRTIKVPTAVNSKLDGLR